MFFNIFVWFYLGLFVCLFGFGFFFFSSVYVCSTIVWSGTLKIVLYWWGYFLFEGVGVWNKNKRMESLLCCNRKPIHAVEFQQVLSEWDTASEKIKAAWCADKGLQSSSFSKGFSVTEILREDPQQLSRLHHWPRVYSGLEYKIELLWAVEGSCSTSPLSAPLMCVQVQLYLTQIFLSPLLPETSSAIPSWSWENWYMWGCTGACRSMSVMIALNISGVALGCFWKSTFKITVNLELCFCMLMVVYGHPALQRWELKND